VIVVLRDGKLWAAGAMAEGTDLCFFGIRVDVICPALRLAAVSDAGGQICARGYAHEDELGGEVLDALDGGVLEDVVGKGEAVAISE
jgi:hypothetical protein